MVSSGKSHTFENHHAAGRSSRTQASQIEHDKQTCQQQARLRQAGESQPRPATPKQENQFLNKTTPFK